MALGDSSTIGWPLSKEPGRERGETRIVVTAGVDVVVVTGVEMGGGNFFC